MTDRLYYADSFLRTFEARVVDIREQARHEGGSEWRISLDRSAFYPTSGGQPHDTGTLTAVSRSGATLEVPVLEVIEDDAGEIWHATSKPLLAGTKVTGDVNWPRRLDHMQQHSGQHLLSAVLANALGAVTVSFHLGDEISTIDLAVESIQPADQDRIEQLVNLTISENLPVSVRTLERVEAERLLAAGAIRKLPDREGSIRLVDMPGIDLNACGGTHVAAIGQIGSLLIRGTEKVRQGTRLSFVCGMRTVRAAHHDNQLLAGLSKALSVPRGELSAALDRKQAELKAAAKERQKLYEELADYHAARLLVEEPIQSGMRIVQRRFTDRDMTYTKLLASRLTSATPQTCAVLSSTIQDSATIILACSKDLVGLHCGQLLSSILAMNGSRGGGSSEMAQGQVALGALQQVCDAIRIQIHETPPSSTRE